MPNILFIFVDGIGLAPPSEHNPFAHAAIPALRGLIGDGLTTTSKTIRSDAAVVPLDATLGVPGLPQSGTGQATLMTGENCARIHGAHFGPYPPSAVRPILSERNLFSKCVARGIPVDFVNAYPQKYFEYLAAHPVMKPAIASSYESAGKRLHTADDLNAGHAISADILADIWNTMGHEGVLPTTAHNAGKQLARIAAEHPFTMFEYWLTDKAGHKQDMQAACTALERLDGLIGGIREAMKEEQLIVITSDHGNMEDLSVATHTFNPVPLITIGKTAVAFTNTAVSLMDVAPLIISLLIAN